MADPNLTEGAWEKAKGDTRGAIKTPTFGIGATIVGFLFGAAALIASEGQPATTQAGLSVFFGVLSIGISLVFTFLVQLVAAPVRQRNALREAWPSSSSSDQPSNVKAKLWNAYRKGVDLETRLEDEPAASASSDRRQVEEWSEETGALLAEGVPAGDCKRFFTAGQYLASQTDVVGARTTALKEIIEGLGQNHPDDVPALK